MITIDGSAGEGGGQVLRTALGLSLLTGQGFRIDNIRGKRKKPGLMRQHLTAVKAACEIGGAECDGATLGSREISFRPRSVQAGRYHWAIGTAGSCTLVLQTVLPALLLADGPSELLLEGGTHNPMAPPFDFLETTFLPLINRLGPRVEVELIRPGYFPAGGGKLRVRITPAPRLAPLELIERGEIAAVTAVAVCAELPGHICRRELEVCRRKLGLGEEDTQIVQLGSHGPGNVLAVFVRSALLTETFTGFGEKRLSAEKVAGRVVGQVNAYLESGAPVGELLADQLLIPLALTGKGRFHTGKPSLHTTTNIKVIRTMLDIGIEAKQLDGKRWEISTP